jgi:hypothetical protein
MRVTPRLAKVWEVDVSFAPSNGYGVTIKSEVVSDLPTLNRRDLR